jgi:VanZ family protein
MKKLIIFIRPYSVYLLIFWLVTIAAVSSIPHLPMPKIGSGKSEIRLDYLVHFCEYCALIFLSLLSFAGKDFKLSVRKYILITIAVGAFAIADEFHQKLIPGRTFNTKDILSNLAGIFCGAVFCILLFRSMSADIKRSQINKP